MREIFSGRVAMTAWVSLLAVIALSADSCKTKNDDCNIPCYSGTCVNNSCNCNTGYEGDSCTMLTTTKFIGSWNATDSCDVTGNYNYTVTVAASSEVLNQLVITNFGEWGSTFVVNADIAGFNFTVPQQLVQGITISGSGVIDTTTKTITVNYSATDLNGGLDQCGGVWVLEQ